MTTALSAPEARTIRPDTDTDVTWHRNADAAGAASLAHAPEWLAVIQNAYGHDPLYLVGEDGDGRPGLLPAFIVRRPFFGTIVSSMPFLDTGGPCSSSPALNALLVERLLSNARRLGAQAVEVRCTQRLSLDVEPMQSKVRLMLDLPSDAGRLWRQLGGSVRNQVRKAERSGLSVDVGGVDQLAAFYDTFAVRMRDLGSPVHGREFLRAVLDSFGNRARVVVIRKGSTPVGGLVAIAFNDTVAVPWASCLQEYFPLCPNMLLYWATLRTACAEGFRRFDFGRSTRDSSTYRFKRQWGAREEPLFWYTVPLGGSRRSALPTVNGRAALLTKVWRRLPLSVTTRIGPPVRKYLTQ